MIISSEIEKVENFGKRVGKSGKSTLRAKNANFWQEILKSLGNLAIWQLVFNFGNFQNWELSILATFNFGNFQFWQLLILATFNFVNF